MEGIAAKRGEMVAAEGRVILASGSRARVEMLHRAGVDCDVVPSDIDEDAVKRVLDGQGADAETVARALAESKAASVAPRYPGRLVVGADQVLDCGGVLYDKPRDRVGAVAQLRALRGREHVLVSAVCVFQDGKSVWSTVDRARLSMRRLSDAFIESYLAAIGEDACAGPGAYRVEGLGIQLFERIEGDHFTILGLPLLPLLDFFRARGALVP